MCFPSKLSSLMPHVPCLTLAVTLSSIWAVQIGSGLFVPDRVFFFSLCMHLHLRGVLVSVGF